MIVLLMGVAGSGKTTIGELLSQKIGWQFFDADAFHPPANIEKQSRGVPLTDEDRWPWLENMHSKMLELERSGSNGIFACSALKAQYRELLRADVASFLIVHLHGDKEMIRKRVATRKGHFMPASLVDNQFATLEEPAGALVVDVENPPEQIIKSIVSAVTRQKNG